MTGPLAPIDTAVSLMHEGRFVEAEDVMVRELRAVTVRHGHGSAAWASAQCDLGNILLNCEQPARAIDCYRQAISVPAVDRKEHLTYRLNLGLALRLVGRLEEAEQELRRGAEERQAFYGRDHAGYAFGLEPLADVLLQRGNVRQAREVVEETVRNLWGNGHDHLASALALRAEIVHAGGAGEPLFPGLDQLPEATADGILSAVTYRHGLADPATHHAVLAALAAAVDARLGPDHPTTLNALAALANAGYDSGDQTGRVDAIRRVLASYDRQGRAEDALTAELGLALAHGDAGDRDASLRTYESAHRRAVGIDRPELTSQVLRNWGLALQDAGRTEQAERCLTDAVAQAQRGADFEILGRAGIALGIFLQHQDRLPRARQALEAGLASLAPAHPDAISGRGHLGAVLDGRGCGCGDVQGAVEEAFREFVTSRLPHDLLERFEARIVDGDWRMDVHLRREPAEGELERLNGVVQAALAEFRHRALNRS
ncbi:tetratricopeptide repeat protein [Dactylosporangium sp. NPDC005555]|uniref:tetratricopeptide repeat protein n=1 Tax=Dactylosporangium sp. NPDC005555 TaxID=3154889 RepID=UPI0033B83049